MNWNDLSVELLHPGTGTRSGVLDGLRVRVSAGEIVGVTGPSGGETSRIDSPRNRPTPRPLLVCSLDSRFTIAHRPSSLAS